jgi:hypothetical protein
MGSNQIVELIAHENMFDGTIPESLFNNIDMKNLRLDSNNFRGQLNSAVGDLLNLVELRLGRNMFSGSLPSSLWKLTKLRKCSSTLVLVEPFECQSRFLTVVPLN